MAWRKALNIMAISMTVLVVVAILIPDDTPLTSYRDEAARLARLKPDNVTCVESTGFWGLACRSDPVGFELGVKISDEMNAYDGDCERDARPLCLTFLSRPLSELDIPTDILEPCQKSVGMLIGRRTKSFLTQCGLGPDGQKLSFKIFRQASF